MTIFAQRGPLTRKKAVANGTRARSNVAHPNYIELGGGFDDMGNKNSMKRFWLRAAPLVYDTTESVQVPLLSIQECRGSSRAEVGVCSKSSCRAER